MAISRHTKISPHAKSRAKNKKEVAPLSAAEALALAARAEMREFTKNDWDAFSGCESSTPRIGELYLDPHSDGRDVMTVIVDGDVITVYADTSSCTTDDPNGLLFEGRLRRR